MKDFRETASHFDRLIKQTKKVHFVHKVEKSYLNKIFSNSEHCKDKLFKYTKNKTFYLLSIRTQQYKRERKHTAILTGRNGISDQLSKGQSTC